MSLSAACDSIDNLVNAQTVEVSAKLAEPSFQTTVGVNFVNTSQLPLMICSPSVHFDPGSGSGLLE